jgi:hypothetical protein
MENTRVLEWVLQSFGGVLLMFTMGLATFALKEIYRLRSDHSALSAKVSAIDDENQRSFLRIEKWLSGLSEKMDALLERGRGNGHKS